jgi:MYXO-CTERM domain-containing protein
MTEQVGTEIERVGFGIYDAASMALDGKKRTGLTTVTSVPAGDDTFIAGDPDLITCSGDSGGPAYMTVDGTTYLAGVHSFGLEGCTSPHNGDTRVELYAADFIQPWIQENDPTCGADLICAPIGCIDDPDCEPCGPDGTCTAGCALPDVDCQDRNLGDLCRADSQCTTDACVVWREEANTSFCTESCDPSNDTCPSGMTCLEIVPLGNVCYYDDAPAGVLGSSCEENFDCGSSICENNSCVYACDLSKGLRCPDKFECSDEGSGYYCHALPSESGGCSVSGSSQNFGFLLLGLLLIFRRSRRK